MKDGSGSASNSLAIAERQKPAPSCVAVLSQMFAKRKLFSSTSKKSKLLPQVRAQKFSPGRPSGGGDTSPAVKRRPLLLDCAEYSKRAKSECSPTNFLPSPDQEQNCSEMRTPGVVGRLMGLTSMPVASHQTPTKVTEPSKPGDHRNAGSQEWSGTSRSIYTSPQKQQKTERFVDDNRHGNASQFSAPDTRPSWPRGHAHKIASTVKSPRSMSSRNKARLIEASAKVLEPGLQSRDPRLSRRRRHADLENSCNGCDGAPGAAAVLHNNLSRQFLAGSICDADAPIFSSHSIGATSLHNSTSNQWTEEVGKCTIPVRRSDQNLSCQMQPEGNHKGLLVSLSEKPGFGDNVQRATNCVPVTNQGIRRNNLKNQGSVSGGPLKQNNQKQNALPAPCREADPGYTTQRHKHGSRERNATNKGQDFVSLNKTMTGSTSLTLRSKRKVMDRFSESHTSAENMSTKGRQTSSQHSDRSNKLKPKTAAAAQRAMEKDMIIAKGAGLVSEKPKPASPNRARSDLQRQAVPHNVSRCNKKSGIVSLNSSMKVAPASLRCNNASITGSAVQGCSVGTCPKRHSRRDGQSKHLPRELDFRVVQGASSLETAESVSVNQEKLKHRDIDGTTASSLLEKMSAVPVTVESSGNEQKWQCKSVDSATLCLSNPSKQVQLHETHKTDAKGRRTSPSITICSNKQSPTSNLQSTYADDAFSSGIDINTGAFTDSHPMETCTPATASQNVTSEGDSSCAVPNSGLHGAHPFKTAVQDSKLTHPGKVTSTVELLLSNVCSSTGHQSKESSKTFLLQTIKSALATLTTNAKQDFSITMTTEVYRLRDLAIDFVLEFLDLMCTELCDSGYGSFSKLSQICKEERLAAEVRKEIAKCSNMAGRALDDLAVGDVEHMVEAGMNSMLEALQISTQIEQDLVQELVNEIGVDMFKRF